MRDYAATVCTAILDSPAGAPNAKAEYPGHKERILWQM
jgi:hypothetical protein